MMKTNYRYAIVACFLAICSVPMSALAQDKSGYPSRTVRLVVPFPAGQATDMNARLLADRLSKRWGQAVYVDNKGGGAGIPGMMAGRDAPADGYTITFGSSSTTAVNEALYPKLPYNMRDFIPVAPVFSQSWLIVASPDAPYKSFKDVVEAAKKDPGKLNWGFGASALELAAVLLNQRADIDVVGVNYKGSAATVNDLAGGHIKLGVETMAATLPQVKSGRIKAIANLSDQRSALLPDVPTVAEQGYPGFVALGWAGLFVPKGTPVEIVNKISRDVNEVLREPAVQQAITAQGSDVDLRTRAEWTSFVNTETEKWIQVIKKGNIKAPK
jgi:tripartite-type tricarboxylate transporter receptor subunit TctC